MKKRISSLLALIVLVTTFLNKEIGAEAVDKAVLQVIKYEVTNQTITPGSEFNLTFTLKNYGDLTAQNVVINVTNPQNVVPKYGTVTNAYVDRISPNEEVTISFDYSANSTIVSSEVNFEIVIVADIASTSAQLRVPVGRVTDFEINEKSIPQKVEVGKVSYASAQVKNVGDRGVSNVEMVARVDGKEVASAQIGSIPAMTFKTQYVGIQFDEPGKKALDLVLTYTNSEGEEKEYMISSTIISVIEEDVLGDSEITIDDVYQTQIEEESNVGPNNVLILSISGVLLIGVCCVILLIMYRRK